MTVAALGYGEAGEANMWLLLESFNDVHPEVGAAVGGDEAAGTIDVTFSLEAADWQRAADLGRPIFVEAYEASGLPVTDVVRVEVEPVPAEELGEQDREPALT